MCWVLASGIVQLLSRGLSGRGSFEDTAAAVGFGIGIATWSSLVHDLTDAALGAAGVIDMKAYEAALNGPTFWRALLWTLYSIYFVWLLVLFAKGIRLAHTISHWKSAFLALVGFLVYQAVFLVFNR